MEELLKVTPVTKTYVSHQSVTTPKGKETKVVEIFQDHYVSTNTGAGETPVNNLYLSEKQFFY